MRAFAEARSSKGTAMSSEETVVCSTLGDLAGCSS